MASEAPIQPEGIAGLQPPSAHTEGDATPQPAPKRSWR